MDKKIIIIGLDGVDFRYITPLLKENKLPNTKKIIERGFCAKFESCQVPLTSPAWATILTGRTPLTHKILDVVSLDKNYNFEITHSKGIDEKYFWEYLSEQGVKSLVINVPMVYPAREVKNAKIISGFDAPLNGKSFCAPSNYLEKLKEKGIIYDWHKFQYKLCQLEDIKKHFDKFKEGMWRQYNTVIKIAKIEEWNCLFTVFQFTDWIIHKTKCPFMINKTYIELDKIIGCFLKEFTNANFFILSDHGSSSAHYRVSINKILFDLGLLVTKKELINEDIIFSGARRKFNNRKVAVFISKIYQALPNKFKRAISEFLYKRYPHLRLKRECIDIKKSKAFYIGFGSIYINSKWNFSKGRVEEKEAVEIKEKIKEAFKNIKTSKNQEIIEVFELPKKSKVFNYTNQAFPDLLIRANLPGYYLTDIGFSGQVIEKVEKEIGVHFKIGIFLGAGPFIPKIEKKIESSISRFRSNFVYSI